MLKLPHWFSPHFRNVAYPQIPIAEYISWPLDVIFASYTLTNLERAVQK